MHGLVVVNSDPKPMRPAIIWCDSRAIDFGEEGLERIGEEKALKHLLNHPGNFTAAKLAWFKHSEPVAFSRMNKFMLPGDYIAMKLTGYPTTTDAGLSEGIFWDFEKEEISEDIMDTYGFSTDNIPDRVPTFTDTLKISKSVAHMLGMSDEVRISYRAGDQPNNAFSLNVLQPGEIAATAGTSGVIYAVTDNNFYDPESRVNTFLHVNNAKEQKRNGVLVCINGTGITYRWLRNTFSVDGTLEYEQLNELVSKTNPGAKQLYFLPFGNGAERVLKNRNIGAHLINMDFNQHSTGHILRAALEGIIFGMNIGFEILKENNIHSDTIKVGHANLFLSETFQDIFAHVTGTHFELYNTDGAAGAARGAAYGLGHYTSFDEIFKTLKCIKRIEPLPSKVEQYRNIYGTWKEKLDQIMAES
jgi:xylulokinase